MIKPLPGTVQVAGEYGAFSDGTECPVGRASASTLTCWPGRSEAGCESVASVAPSAADLTAIGNSTPDGFTGHEMLDGVGLIHMRGRVYDPAVGRFLSVDPIVRDAGASQSWNGYGYVEGRMLSARDPSGWSTEEIVVSATRDGGPGLRSNVSFGLDSYFRQLRAARAWTPASERQIDLGGWPVPLRVEEVVVVTGAPIPEPVPPPVTLASVDAEAPPSFGPIPPPRLPCETDVAILVNLTGTAVEPLVDLNIAVLATKTDRLSRAAACGFAYVGVGLALNDIYRGWDEGNNTRVAWGVMDLVASGASVNPLLAPVTSTYFMARFVVSMHQPAGQRSSCGP